MDALELSELDSIPTHDTTPAASAATQTYGPPSPLITLAPDSPSLSPILSIVSSLEDLTSTLKARPAALPHEEPPLPAAASGFTAHSKASKPPLHNIPKIHETAPTPFAQPKPEDPTSSFHPHPMLGPLINTDLQTRTIKNFRNPPETHDYNQHQNDMPRGYPYQNWRDYGYLALEWLGAMSGRLFGFMESEIRLMNGARHTI
ncbi:MAG: hypothetical protein LQ350_003087 [Teloschistes chrysophthalmus]|nr:MAG: hypothetical protein LQ350_003087 [Niorma chrysophthalma]